MKFFSQIFTGRRVVCAAGSFVVCVFAAGCGKAVQVVVPGDFHGALVVHCTSTGMNTAPLRADGNGVADGVCPASETGVQVFRAGQQAVVSGSPGWTRTADGTPTSIRVEVD